VKATAVAVFGLMSRIGSAVGIEGALLLIGTIALSIGSAFISPAGPWVVVGIMCILAGIALALPGRRT
jgi:hypothetical protein